MYYQSLFDRMSAMLRIKDVAVLATASAKGPHASLMAYAASADCRRLMNMAAGRPGVDERPERAYTPFSPMRQ